MIKILEVNPNTNDAMSFYRGRGPLQQLKKSYPTEIDFYPMGSGINCNWDMLGIFDLVFLLRPFDQGHINLMTTCKQYGIPTWVDYDDLLTNVPIENPAYPTYSTNAAKKNIKDILDMASVITFSTEHLRQTMGKDVLEKSYTIPNAHYNKMLRNPAPFFPHKKVVWRGSKTHERDLQQFEGPIRDVMKNYQKNGNIEWNIEFMGMYPLSVTDYIESIFIPYMDKNSYFRYLSEVEGSISIVPLSHRPEELDFNKSKSNIAWLEATYAGMVCLCPDWPEWRKPGIVNYKDNLDFKEKLTAMIEGKFDLKSLHQLSWQYICSELTLEKVNQQRLSVIRLSQKPD